ncbi:hypothetical protein ACFJIV_27125 [Mucilaginibacter sp. UC70_90]
MIFHYNNLIDFKKNKSLLQRAFPQRLTQADIDAVKLTYQKIIMDDQSMQEIEQIITYALGKMDPAIKTGRDIYDFVESHVNIDPVGIIPLLPYHGYFSLQNGKSNEPTGYYEYQITIFEGKDDKYRGINVAFIDAYSKASPIPPKALNCISLTVTSLCPILRFTMFTVISLSRLSKRCCRWPKEAW